MTDQQHTEQPPSLEQMEGAKSALLTFAMYYFQALRQHGHDVDTAKQMVAEEILSLYERYAKLAGIKFKPTVTVNPLKLLDEIISDVKALAEYQPLAIAVKPIQNKLIDFKNTIEYKEDSHGRT